MTSIVTLISSPSYHLETSHIQQVTEALTARGVSITQKSWLSPHHACDLYCEGERGAIAEGIQQALEAKPVDYAVLSASHRQKKLLISDMDSTIIQQECIDELADFVGKKAIIAEITERAMNGELDFKAALRERVSMLAGLPESVLETAYRERITLMPGAKTLIATMRKQGAMCVLVSGGFTFFTSRIREAVGFHLDEANVLDIVNGVLTGKVKEPILDKEAKLASLNHHAGRLGLEKEATLAVGDGANDLPMIKGSGLGVAYHAKPTVRKEASVSITHNDLTALLYLQGYSIDQFQS